MPRIPKYKSVPIYAYRYAKRKGILSNEHEKVFIKDPPLAIEYALLIKSNRLTEVVENEVINFYYEATKKLNNPNISEYNEQIYKRKFFDPFFNYLKMVKSVPKDCENKFLDNFPEDLIIKYALCTEKRLDPKYENILLHDAVKRGKIGHLVEYSYAIGSKLPENMHNYVISYAIKNNEDYLIKSYMNNLKNLKKYLAKISSTFGENKTVKEIIDQL